MRKRKWKAFFSDRVLISIFLDLYHLQNKKKLQRSGHWKTRATLTKPTLDHRYESKTVLRIKTPKEKKERLRARTKSGGVPLIRFLERGTPYQPALLPLEASVSPARRPLRNAFWSNLGLVLIAKMVSGGHSLMRRSVNVLLTCRNCFFLLGLAALRYTARGNVIRWWDEKTLPYKKKKQKKISC